MLTILDCFAWTTRDAHVHPYGTGVLACTLNVGSYKEGPPNSHTFTLGIVAVATSKASVDTPQALACSFFLLFVVSAVRILHAACFPLLSLSRSEELLLGSGSPSLHPSAILASGLLCSCGWLSALVAWAVLVMWLEVFGLRILERERQSIK